MVWVAVDRVGEKKETILKGGDTLARAVMPLHGVGRTVKIMEEGWEAKEGWVEAIKPVQSFIACLKITC